MSQIGDTSGDNRAELERSDVCGCFYCLRIFTPATIKAWCRRGRRAICPYCGIDTGIGSASGKAITPELLAEMHRANGFSSL